MFSKAPFSLAIKLNAIAVSREPLGPTTHWSDNDHLLVAVGRVCDNPSEFLWHPPPESNIRTRSGAAS
jgi:hypothetical protein